jgi:ketosteroid isomerase-like protein
MPSQALTTVQRFFDAFLAGDAEALRELISADVVFHEPPELPYGGDHQGYEGLMHLAQQIMGEFEFRVDGVEMIDLGDDRVVIHEIGVFVSHQTKREARFPIVEIYTVKDGRITDVDMYYKAPGALRTLHDPAA